MHYLKNLIMLFVNGASIVFYGFTLDWLIKKFDITSSTAHSIIIIGSIVAFLPLIFKMDVFVKKTSWQTEFLIFWKRTNHKNETVRQISILGIIPIRETVVCSTHSFDQPPLEQISNEVLEVATAFLPIINSYIALGRNLKKLR